MRHPLAATILFSLCCASPAAAQGFVSPPNYATVEGEVGNNFPWTDRGVNTRTRTYQQLHGGIPARTVRGLSFRPNRPTATNTFTGTNQLVLDLSLGPGRPPSQMSYVFANNYTAPPTRVSTGQRLNIPAQGTLSFPGPNAFSLSIPFQSPYVHRGGALTWEVNVLSSSYAAMPLMQSYDAVQSSYARSVMVPIGGGCLVPGQGGVFRVFQDYVDANGALQLNHQVFSGVPNAPVFLSLGLSDPNLSLPGFCTAFRTDQTVVIPLGALSADGALTVHDAERSTFVLPNQSALTQIYAQAHALQTLPSGGTTIWNSRAGASQLPLPNPLRSVDIARNWNNLGGSRATSGMWGAGFNIGYGLVTRFD